MVNDKNFKKLPQDIKFATTESEDENDFVMEMLIANLINNGESFNKLIRATEGINDEKDKKEMKEKITNITLDFIRLNPKFAILLKENDEVSRYLGFLGIDL